jgi:hypothetical protein
MDGAFKRSPVPHVERHSMWQDELTYLLRVVGCRPSEIGERQLSSGLENAT